MQKSTIGLGLVLSLSLWAGACAANHTETGANASASPAANSKMSNSDLENAIKTRINSDADLRAADLGVDADADKNEVTLKGTVTSEAMRTRAVSLAKEAHAGLVVTDKIDVKPGEKTASSRANGDHVGAVVTRKEYTEEQAKEERTRAKGYKENVGGSLDDAWIHTKIVAQLIGNADTPERKINVDVVNNTVTLRGTVDSAEQKMEAEKVAKSTEGVKKVVNQLKVGAAKSAER